MMKSLRFWFTATAIFLLTLPNIGQACSPARVSLYEQFSKHSKVFLGTVRERIREAAPGQGVYTIFVDEALRIGLTAMTASGGLKARLIVRIKRLSTVTVAAMAPM